MGAHPSIITTMPASTVPTVQDVQVPETLLKKRKAQDKSVADKRTALLEARKQRKAKRSVIFKRAEQYVNEYKNKEREEVRLRRLAKSKGDYFVPAQPKVYFVMRIRGINNGVFVKVTHATSQMLLAVEPYITYGEPNLKTIRELVYKRGYGKVNGQRIPLDNNKLIEDCLGKHGIICLEDIVHELATAGPAFKQVANFLWPFKLSNPLGGSRPRKFLTFIEGGETGKRESHINELVRASN